MGDEVDKHGLSFHDSDSELPSAGDELTLSQERIVGWSKAFPTLKLLESNHGSLIYRRAKHHGIPLEYFKPLKEVYNTPKWSWHEHIILKTKKGNVYLCHGKAGPYQKLAKEVGCSAVQGHFHGKFEITWSNSVFHQRFNMFTGCGVSRESLAMAYGKNNIPQPMLGCGRVDGDGIPHLHKMNLNSNNRWDKKL